MDTPEVAITNEQTERPNWTADARFKEACEAADATHSTDLSHKEAVCEALRRTLCLIEDYRGEHREEIASYLKGTAGLALDKDDVLPIVKHVFARQDKRQWTWHANALRQAIADGKHADDLHAYFKATPPTQAAKKWSEAHRKQGNRRQPLEITLTNPPKLPTGLDDKIASANGMPVRLVRRDGKIVLLIPQSSKQAA